MKKLTFNILKSLQEVWYPNREKFDTTMERSQPSFYIIPAIYQMRYKLNNTAYGMK